MPRPYGDVLHWEALRPFDSVAARPAQDMLRFFSLSLALWVAALRFLRVSRTENRRAAPYPPVEG
ncbi:MAG TPA: hypothetical protein VFP63_05925 [Dehalococcoidia bacterium]|nr:hypothetical protein [Dehalococcoidia bacterium]